MIVLVHGVKLECGSPCRPPVGWLRPKRTMAMLARLATTRRSQLAMKELAKKEPAMTGCATAMTATMARTQLS